MGRLVVATLALVIFASAPIITQAKTKIYIAQQGSKAPVVKKGESSITVPVVKNSKIVFKAPKKGKYNIVITDIISADESAKLKIKVGKKIFKQLETRYILHYSNKLFENGIDKEKALQKGYKLMDKLAAKGWYSTPIDVTVELRKGQKIAITHGIPKSRTGQAEGVVYTLNISKVK